MKFLVLTLLAVLSVNHAHASKPKCTVKLIGNGFEVTEETMTDLHDYRWDLWDEKNTTEPDAIAYSERSDEAFFHVDSKAAKYELFLEYGGHERIFSGISFHGKTPEIAARRARTHLTRKLIRKLPDCSILKNKKTN